MIVLGFSPCYSVPASPGSRQSYNSISGERTGRQQQLGWSTRMAAARSVPVGSGWGRCVAVLIAAGARRGGPAFCPTSRSRRHCFGCTTTMCGCLTYTSVAGAIPLSASAISVSSGSSPRASSVSRGTHLIIVITRGISPSGHHSYALPESPDQRPPTCTAWVNSHQTFSHAQ